MAPPSWRAATKRAPAATSALQTAKLPLPISPNASRTPSRARVRPTASATSTPATSALDEREDARRAARAADDRERRDDDQRAGRRQPLQVGELCQAVLAGAVQERVAGEGRVEAVCDPGVGPDRLDA